MINKSLFNVDNSKKLAQRPNERKVLIEKLFYIKSRVSEIETKIIAASPYKSLSPRIRKDQDRASRGDSDSPGMFDQRLQASSRERNPNMHGYQSAGHYTERQHVNKRRD